MDQPPRVPLPRADGLTRRQGLLPPKRNAVRYSLGDGFAQFPGRADEQAVFADDHAGFLQSSFRLGLSFAIATSQRLNWRKLTAR